MPFAVWKSSEKIIGRIFQKHQDHFFFLSGAFHFLQSAGIEAGQIILFFRFYRYLCRKKGIDIWPKESF